jgi:hypothetical protein
MLPDAAAIDYGGVRGPDWYEGVGARVAAAAGASPWIAVLHSGAGGFAPAIAAAAANLAGLIFVDAVLPYPGRSWLEHAPAALAERLRRLAADGHLPPWNQWFDADPAPRLIADAARRSTFVQELPRAPFAFLEAACPAEHRWERLPAAYAQLSTAYDAEAAQAGERGWAVRSARLNHLAMLSHPDKVAAVLSELSESLTRP